MKKTLLAFIFAMVLIGSAIYATSKIIEPKQSKTFPNSLTGPVDKKTISTDLLNKKLMTTKKYSFPTTTTNQTTPKVVSSKMSTVPKIKAIYMNKIDIDNLIIGDQVLEDEMVSFLIQHHFNTVYMYDLSTVLSTSQGRTNCGNFIARLKALQINCVGIGSSFGTLGDATVPNSRAKFNEQMMAEGHPEKKFFGFNLELEAWRYPAENTSTWPEWQSIITKTKEYTTPKGIQLDAYIGNLIDKQSIQSESVLANFIYLNFNTLLVHCYVTSTKALQKDALFKYLLTRLNPLGNAAIRNTPSGQPIRKLNVIVILSASAGKIKDGVLVEVHMHDYFLTHNLEQPFAEIITSANTTTWTGMKGINITGVCGYGLQEFYAVWPH